MDVRYTERAASWRPLGVVIALCVAGFLVDWALPGHQAHLLGWGLALLAVGGVVTVVSIARIQFSSLTVTETQLRVGREVLPLSSVDTSYFGTDDAGGPPVGARLLGGAVAVPRGRTPMPLRLSDGTVVLVPCRDPEALRAVLTDAH